jgi:hypothetical protein
MFVIITWWTQALAQLRTEPNKANQRLNDLEMIVLKIVPQQLLMQKSCKLRNFLFVISHLLDKKSASLHREKQMTRKIAPSNFRSHGKRNSM